MLQRLPVPVLLAHDDADVVLHHAEACVIAEPGEGAAGRVRRLQGAVELAELVQASQRCVVGAGRLELVSGAFKEVQRRVVLRQRSRVVATEEPCIALRAQPVATRLVVVQLLGEPDDGRRQVFRPLEVHSQEAVHLAEQALGRRPMAKLGMGIQVGAPRRGAFLLQQSGEEPVRGWFG